MRNLGFDEGLQNRVGYIAKATEEQLRKQAVETKWADEIRKATARRRHGHSLTPA